MKSLACSRWNNLLRKLWNLMLRIKWNKIRSSICRRHISHLRGKYFTSKIFHSFRRNEFHWKRHLQMQVPFSGGRGWIRTTEAETTDLQSAPFDRSGTLPYSVFVEVGKKLELVDGFEPPTCWLQISCSTSWATPASQRSNNISQIERWVKP